MKKKGTRSISEAIKMAWSDMDNTTDYRSTVFHAPMLVFTHSGVHQYGGHGRHNIEGSSQDATSGKA